MDLFTDLAIKLSFKSKLYTTPIYADVMLNNTRKT